MVKNSVTKKNSKSFEEILWDSANKLRGPVGEIDSQRAEI